MFMRVLFFIVFILLGKMVTSCVAFGCTNRMKKGPEYHSIAFLTKTLIFCTNGIELSGGKNGFQIKHNILAYTHKHIHIYTFSNKFQHLLMPEQDSSLASLRSSGVSR